MWCRVKEYIYMLYLAVTETGGSNAQKARWKTTGLLWKSERFQFGLCYICRNAHRLLEIPVRRSDHPFHFVSLKRLRHHVVSSDIQNFSP
jgi:hypothetical protein